MTHMHNAKGIIEGATSQGLAWSASTTTAPGRYVPSTRRTSVYRRPAILAETTKQSRRIEALKPRLRELVEMLEYARPEGTDTEEAFISKYIDPLPFCRKDDYGNRIVQVGKDKPTIAWTCHTDTVAWIEGKQALHLDKDGIIGLADWSDGDCLGADCTGGVWLMRRMILAGKAGLYIFHRAEESGGNGSTWIAENTPELVQGIDAMISLDRKGTTSVITEQSTGRTASNAFARSLAAQLPGHYKPDNGGTFTDSAFYSHLVPECSNVSIGYEHAHTTRETLDLWHIDALLLRLVTLDYEALVIGRTPCPPTQRYYGGHGGYYYHGADFDGYAPVDDYPGSDDHVKPGQGSDNATSYSGLPFDYDGDLAAMVRRYPETVALMLSDYGLGIDDLNDYLEAR